MPRIKVTKMQRRNSRKSGHAASQRRLWHVPALILLEATLPDACRLYSEFRFRTDPQRADFVIVQKPALLEYAPEAAVHADDRAPLTALYGRLDTINLIEFKGGTDRVDRLDVYTLLGYAAQLRVTVDRPQAQVTRNPQSGVRRHQALEGAASGSVIKLFVLAPRVTGGFLEGMAAVAGHLTVAGEGVWEGGMSGFELVFIETEVAWHGTAEDKLLYALTRGVVEAPEAAGRMTKSEEVVYHRILDWLSLHPEEEFDAMGIRLDKLEKYRRAMIDSIPLEERLSGLKPEEVLSAFKPDQYASLLMNPEVTGKLSPEQRRELAEALLKQG